MSTWEEYHTGTLFLGYFNGPTEGILMAVAVLTITGFHGPEFWLQTVGETIGRLPLIANFTLQGTMMLFVSLAFLCAHAPFWCRTSFLGTGSQLTLTNRAAFSTFTTTSRLGTLERSPLVDLLSRCKRPTASFCPSSPSPSSAERGSSALTRS